jgi:hypothetical protein
MAAEAVDSALLPSVSVPDELFPQAVKKIRAVAEMSSLSVDVIVMMPRDQKVSLLGFGHLQSNFKVSIYKSYMI